MSCDTQESFEKQKLALKALSISWPDKVQSLVAIERTKLKKGMVVLAMDYNTSLFCRALVLSIDNDVDAEFPVTYLDLDEGEEFIASFAPTFVIPPEYRKTYFQVIQFIIIRKGNSTDQRTHILSLIGHQSGAQWT